MTHWLTQLISHNSHPPETLNEAVDRLLTILDSEEKIKLARLSEDKLVDLHFTLGMAA